MNPQFRSFTSSDGSQLGLDIFLPSSSRHQTAVLLIHGGGWRSGDRSKMHRYASHLAGQGFTTVAIQYRLLDAAPWPAQRDDVEDAVKWVRAHASELGISPEKVVLEGFSAGAHLALMAAARDPTLAAVIAFFPPTRLAIRSDGSSLIAADMILGPNVTEEQAAAISPITQISSSFPPVFLLHGGADWLVPPSSSRAMYEALIAAGRVAELHIFADAHHEFASESALIAPIQNEVAAFLHRTVIARDAHVAAGLRENPFAGGPESFAAFLEKERQQATSLQTQG